MYWFAAIAWRSSPSTLSYRLNNEVQRYGVDAMTLSDGNSPSKEPGYIRYQDTLNDEFLDELGRDFGIDVTDILVRERLYEVPHRYHLANRIDDRGEAARDIRKSYERLAKKIEDFQAELQKFNGYGFASEFRTGAGYLPDFDPNLDSEDYPSFIYKSSIAYEFEFYRYLNFLQIGVDRKIKRMMPKGGRPKNEGLHLAINYICEFWTHHLKRSYTLDYHAGSGISEAFDFTNRVIQKIDAIDERQVISAMRAEIRDRRQFEKDMAEFRSQEPW